jgi:3-deoxy-7-phosphoheptulonate synthase
MNSIPTPRELHRQIQATVQDICFVQECRNTIKEILSGADSRLLLIVGPCSLHDLDAAKEYALKLKHLSLTVSDRFFVVMRAYFEKPRSCWGWKGLMNDPDLDGTCNLEKGMILSRAFLQFLAKEQVPAACEFLDPLAAPYFSDLISWGCIGARTASSQVHRQMASGLPMPVGFKNNTDGNITSCVKSASASKQKHTFLSLNDEGKVCIKKTFGNPDCHIVLRGGEFGENYNPSAISYALSLLEKEGLERHLLVDCSHDNAKKNGEAQTKVFQSVIEQIQEGNSLIKGLLLESFLYAGSQSLSPSLKYGVSVTDPCLDFKTTQDLILSVPVIHQEEVLV